MSDPDTRTGNVEVTALPRSNAMHKACRERDIRTVRSLLDSGSAEYYLRSADENGKNPFHIVCAMGSIEIVQLLVVDARNDCNAKTKDGIEHTGFTLACCNGKTALARMLLNATLPITNARVIDADARTSEGFSGFMLACGLGHKETVEALLQINRIDLLVNGASKTGMTGLMLAARGKHASIVSLLLKDSRIAANMQDLMGETALMKACAVGDFTTVSAFFEIHNRVLVNLVSKAGMTAVDYCADEHLRRYVESFASGERPPIRTASSFPPSPSIATLSSAYPGAVPTSPTATYTSSFYSGPVREYRPKLERSSTGASSAWSGPPSPRPLCSDGGFYSSPPPVHQPRSY